MADFEMDDSFADFVSELETSEKNESANCSLDGGECTSCGS